MGWFDLIGFVGILRESIKLLAKNGKPITVITATSIFLQSLLFFINIFSTKTIFQDLFAKETLLLLTGRESPEFSTLLLGVKEDVRILLELDWAMSLASFAVSLFSMAAAVLSSAAVYSGKRLTPVDLLFRLAGLIKRPLLTSSYSAIFFTGYIFFFCLAVLIPLLVALNLPLTFKGPIRIGVGIVVLTHWSYLAVVWVMAMVISVIEKGYSGIEAVGKAGVLVKGNRLHGFFLNLLFAVTSLIVIPGSRMMTRYGKSVSTQIIFGFLLTAFCCLLEMFHYMTYTVLYFQCKKAHGEQIELQGSKEYGGVPYAILVTEDNIP